MSPGSKSPLGIIGLGLLGGALARRALAAGLPVWGYDPDGERREQLVEAGGRAVGSAAEVAEGCQRLLLALPHDGVTREVLTEMGSSLQGGAVILDATTGDPGAAAGFERELAPRGVGYLDAPISGSSAHVERGEAVFLVGGPPAMFAACRELLEALAGAAIHVGACGSGAKMKLVTNLVLGLNRAALAEGLVLAAALGLDGGQALAVLRGSLAYSRIMDTKGEKMVRGDFEPQARLSQHLKDVRLMLEAAAGAGRRLPLSETHRELLELGERLGLGSLDNSAIVRAIDSLRRPGSEA